MREVLPTATSPTRQTLALRCFWPALVDVAIMGHPSSAVLCTAQTRVSPLIILTLQGAVFARTAPSRPARQGTDTHSRRRRPPAPTSTGTDCGRRARPAH